MAYRPSAASSRIKGFGLNMFSEDELYDLHMAILEVLEKTGIKVYDAEARKYFSDAGCKVDESSMIVKFPNWLVEEGIKAAPRKLKLYGREEKNNIVLEGKRVHFCNFGEGVAIVDPDTEEIRDTTLKDLEDLARFCDSLDELDLVERMVAPHDIHPNLHPIVSTRACLFNTSKPFILGGVHEEHVPYIHEMASAVAGGEKELREKPLLAVNCCPTTPLQITESSCRTIMALAKLNIPINLLSMALAGGTSPVTLAGTLVCHNAEILSSILLCQQVSKGTPVIYGSSTTMMDLKTTTSPVGCPEFAMLNAGVAALAQFYGVPSWAAGG